MHFQYSHSNRQFIRLCYPEARSYILKKRYLKAVGFLRGYGTRHWEHPISTHWRDVIGANPNAN